MSDGTGEDPTWTWSDSDTEFPDDGDFDTESDSDDGSEVELDTDEEPEGPGYSVALDVSEDRGSWEGWGGSLAWWGNGVGNSDYDDLYADLFFTRKTVSFLKHELPGLGLNIIRYNVGGGGQGDIPDATENIPGNFPWYKDIDGYWLNWYDKDPTADSWDWYRYSNQRNMMWKARDRGVNLIEFFANAPMWWMMDSKSSGGGRLQSWNRTDMANYLATVVKFATDNWGVTVHSIEPFNEPSAGWWNYPQTQEGCNIPKDEQSKILGYLREELNNRGLNGVIIAASDENSMSQAKTTHEFFQDQTVTVNGASTRTSDIVGRVNVHGYSGLEPWRDNVVRKDLRKTVGNKKI